MFHTTTLLFVATVLSASVGSAQSGSQGSQPPAAQITLPPVTVTAQKEPADVQKIPVSVTVVPIDWLQLGSTVSDAGIYSPNTFFSEFTARKLTNPRFRGIGASPANPSITTFIDGVPVLNANASNVELMDVQQVEFVRGPQSALFGRNTVGGLINVQSARPSLTTWSGQVAVPFGNFDAWDVRANASGPLSDRVAVGVSFTHAERDGFTKNAITGKDIDYRDATSAKAQLLWTPASNWETRLIVSGERARDGDYALNDLATLRATPREAARDFEGNTDRDIFGTTFLARHEGSRYTFTSTTGFVRWKTQDITDLDYSPLPALTRDNTEEANQFTQEVRFASSPAAAVQVNDAVSLAWQAGGFFFTQNFEQFAVNTYAPFVFQAPFPVDQITPDAQLDDFGVSFYGQGTFTVREKFDLSAGLRFDHESKDAVINGSFDPAIFPPSAVDTDQSFSNVSPQFAATFRVTPAQALYASVASGFKAGGFNATSPTDSVTYDEEKAWHIEGGYKSTAMNGRVRFNAAAFWIDWQDLQLNLTNPLAFGQFYIANVGDATSKGVEFELTARAHEAVDLFGSFGYTNATFADDTFGDADLSGNDIPNTPEFTASFGAHVNHALTSAAALYGHAEVVFYGAFAYDETNLARQDSYSLANFRAGVRGRYFFGEAWIRNAFDTEYIPVAFAYPGLAPSGYIGESGRPRTFGISAGFRF